MRLEPREAELPRHLVRITEPFYMGVTEVTNGQYMQFLNDRGFDVRQDTDGHYLSHLPYGDVYASADSDCPVVSVSWQHAREFCEWLSGVSGCTVRLPTEAEWEYACRAGSTTRFYFGDDPARLDIYAWYDANSGARPHGRTRAVRQKMPNRWGLFDMHGNVWEWCANWYGEDYYARSPAQDPQGPTGGVFRVMRGGCFLSTPDECRSAMRLCYSPDTLGPWWGFRVAASATSVGEKKSEEPATHGETLTLDLGDGVHMELVRIPAGEFMMGGGGENTDREHRE